MELVIGGSMSPKIGEEVFLTEIEIEVLAPFVKRKILNDKYIATALITLVDKLEGGYASKTSSTY